MSDQPLLQLSDVLLNAEAFIFVCSAMTATVGVFVVYQAYRGYRRNESHPMLYLAVGVILLTAVPFGVNYSLVVLTAATDAQILLAITVVNLAGVSAILSALTRA